MFRCRMTSLKLWFSIEFNNSPFSTMFFPQSPCWLISPLLLNGIYLHSFRPPPFDCLNFTPLQKMLLNAHSMTNKLLCYIFLFFLRTWIFCAWLKPGRETWNLASFCDLPEGLYFDKLAQTLGWLRRTCLGVEEPFSMSFCEHWVVLFSRTSND